jgi:hypothetical protein
LTRADDKQVEVVVIQANIITLGHSGYLALRLKTLVIYPIGQWRRIIQKRLPGFHFKTMILKRASFSWEYGRERVARMSTCFYLYFRFKNIAGIYGIFRSWRVFRDNKETPVMGA